jgi:hypothetical protein
VNEALQRVQRHVVQRRREHAHRGQHHDRDAEGDEHHRHAGQRLGYRPPLSKQHLARTLPVVAEEGKDEREEHHGVEQRHGEDVDDVHRPPGTQAQRGDRHANRDLGRVTRTDQHFEQRAQAFAQRRPCLFQDGRALQEWRRLIDLCVERHSGRVAHDG